MIYSRDEYLRVYRRGYYCARRNKKYLARIAELESQIQELELRVSELTEKIDENAHAKEELLKMESKILGWEAWESKYQEAK